MYAHIRGTIEDVAHDRAVVEAAGVGYELFCSANTLKQLKQGETDKLYTHFHITQDAVALYGFKSTEERGMFRRLIAVTRVGPKLALSVLGILSVSDIATAILTENAAAFDRVPGMGRKTAARVLLELKEKVSADEMQVPSGSTAAPGRLDVRSEAVAALVSLGYDGVSAGRAVAAVPDSEKVEDVIMAALRELARKG